jgi:hypothetical protein
VATIPRDTLRHGGADGDSGLSVHSAERDSGTSARLLSRRLAATRRTNDASGRPKDGPVSAIRFDSCKRGTVTGRVRVRTITDIVEELSSRNCEESVDVERVPVGVLVEPGTQSPQIPRKATSPSFRSWRKCP